MLITTSISPISPIIVTFCVSIKLSPPSCFGHLFPLLWSSNEVMKERNVTNTMNYTRNKACVTAIGGSEFMRANPSLLSHSLSWEDISPGWGKSESHTKLYLPGIKVMCIVYTVAFNHQHNIFVVMLPFLDDVPPPRQNKYRRTLTAHRL